MMAMRVSGKKRLYAFYEPTVRARAYCTRLEASSTCRFRRVGASVPVQQYSKSKPVLVSCTCMRVVLMADDAI
jgi:hypothetical protein